MGPDIFVGVVCRWLAVLEKLEWAEGVLDSIKLSSDDKFNFLGETLNPASEK